MKFEFIDAHVHLAGPEAVACARSADIDAVRDAGMAGRTVPPSFNSGIHDPIVMASIRALYKQGGYGERFGTAVDTAREIKAEILKLKEAGADIIKVMASGMVSLKKKGTITPGGFSKEELRLIVDEAASLELDVMAHANGEAAIIAAVEAGVRSIEHGFFMTGKSLELMAKKRIYWTPTVSALARAGAAAWTSDEDRKFVSDVINAHVVMIRYAFENGVPLAIGTDLILPHPRYREVYESELAYFEQAGLNRDHVKYIAGEAGAKLLRIPSVSERM